jgi:hypothetical protein
MGAAENEPILASLGTKPLCVYHKEGLPPCSCDLPDQTLCPACPVAIGESSCDIEQDGPFAVLSGLGYTTQLTEPLKLVDAEQQGHLQVDCVALAQLRHRWDASKRRSSVDIRGSDQWSAIKNQEWLRYGVVRPLAEGFDAALLPQWHSAARLGNRVWFSTGNIEDGASSKFPCAPAALDADTLSSLFCDAAPGPLGRSILCGLGDCESTCGGTTAVHRISSLCSAGHSCYFPDTDELFGADGCDGREAIYHRLLRGRRELLRMAGYDVASPSFPGAPSNAFVGAYYVNLVTWALCSSNGLLQATSAVPVPRLEPNALLRSYRLPERSENGWNCLGRPWEFVGEGNDRLYASLRDGAGPGLEASAEESPVVWGGVATCYGQWEVTESSRDQTEVGRCPLALVNPTVIPGDIAAATSGGPNLLLLPEDQWRPIEEDSRTIIGQLRDVYDGEGKENWGAQNASFFDALELACHAVADDANGCPASLEEVPQIDSPAQLPKLERYLDCAADRLAERGATLMLSDLPRSVADDLRNQTISATYPAFRGELGETVAELRGSLEALPAAFAQMSTAIRSFSYAVRIARSQYSVKELEHKISLLQMASETSRNLAACAAASSPATSAGMNAGVTFNYGAAVAICADAGAQFVISMMKTDVVEDIGDHEKGQILDGAGMSFSDALDLLAEGARNLSAGYANVNRLLARLDGQRRKARRQVSRLMFLENDEVGREFAVNRVMRARMNSTLDRYKKARNNAIRLAWLARRAIEQRLGLSLNDIKTDMSLVDAPSTWADSVCDITGINYDELAEGTIDNYATQYVGDYVRQLENFVESYRLDFPFQDGQDIAVLSLKDDLLRLKVPCETEGYNELLWSADLTRPASATADGWEALCSDEGRCPMVQSHPSSPFLGDGLTAASGEQSARRPMGAVSAVRMTLGCAADLYDEQDYSCPVAETAGAGLAQVIEAARRGTYIVSWYERVEASNSPALVAIVTYDDGRKEAVLPDEFLPETQDLFLSTGWGRAAGLVYNAEEQDLEIRFEFRDAQADGGSLPSVVWAAPQVELLTPSFVDNEETVIPWPFFPTDDDFASEVGLCSDTDGSQFHHSGVWTYGCEYFCPDGFSGSCGDGPQDRALQRCYYQTEFALSLTEIEKGELIPSNSLALGNFNYRINSFGLNLVGRNLRDCSRSSSPASCESSGFLSYSLRHGPPYRVRNVWGDVYRAPLFVGNVEHAKALATERVLTNPMRPSTQAQLNQYTREEFRGRPLEGTYRLRIYDVDGLQWENLADVQIFLDYRYWTRFGG